MFFQLLDNQAVNGRSFLHRVNPKFKLSALFLIIILVIIAKNPDPLIIIYLCLLAVLLFTRLPFRITFIPSLYPLVFLLIFFLSVNNLTLFFATIVALRALSIALAVLILLSTTSFLEIFATLGRFIPRELSTVFFLSYRSLFIINKIVSDILESFRLRGAINWKNPLRTITNIANFFGFLIIKTLDKSEKQAQILSLRGFNGKIYYKSHR